ncbi:MAG TPA: carboxypeptidase-like regulatory domain-containing protein [Bryobacteraceae bacterium]|nr:carboxypeptidase-like regulatory domain-containing protein [Bryobacteraceae bacterium]
MSTHNTQRLRTRLKKSFLWLGLFCLAAGSVWAQVATGTITGTVTDPSGAVIPNATLTITNPATAASRTVTSNAQGLFSVPALVAGTYQVKTEVSGFQTVQRDAQVNAGSDTTVNIQMTVGQSTQVVEVEAASSQINYDNAAFAGSVERQSIQDLPLNGRFFMQLATLEPGVTVYGGSTSARNTQVGVIMLGGASGAQGMFTLDGLSIMDVYDGTGTVINFSQEMVQEFQIATLNYDISNSFTGVGSVNIVSRSGSNDLHGSGFYFYRDHNMAAYPALKRSAFNPNPYFQRKNPGGWVSGPLIKDRLFYFFNYEITDQVQAISAQQDLAALQPLNAVISSPQTYHSLNVRLDYHLSDKTSFFVRYTHDGNISFGVNPSGGTGIGLSNWENNNNWSDQYALGVTTAISPTLVNDARLGLRGWVSKETLPTTSQCPAPCIGLGSFQATMLGSATFDVGNNSLGPNERFLHGFHAVDALSWQKGAHQLRFGAENDYQWYMFDWPFNVPGSLAVVAPSVVAATKGFPASSLAAIPTTVSTNQDLLNLPVFTLQPATFQGIGVGPSQTPGPYNYGPDSRNFKPHFFVSDSWKIRPNLTLNYGLGYQFQTGEFDGDMSKPAFLQPLAGVLGGLSPTVNQYDMFEPSVGFAWSPGKSGKWVIRGGAGAYYDTTSAYTKETENSLIGPVGNGHLSVTSGLFTNIFPDIMQQGPGGAFVPLPVGAAIPTQTITNMTLGQFEQIYNQQFPALSALLSPYPPITHGPYTLTDLDYVKVASRLIPHSFPMVHSYQTSLGFQRDLGHDMVLTVDWARRQFEHTLLSAPTTAGAIDLNHANEYINGVVSPVIPFCAASQLFKPGQECSTGALTILDPQGRTIYEAMLLKLSKRFSNHFQFLVSYALQNDNSDTGVYNLNNYMQSYGPVLARHNLNVSGLVQLKWGFELSLNSSIITKSPFNPIVAGIDLTGTGATSSGPLTGINGIGYNCFNAGCDQAQLAGAVAQWNSTLAGTKAPNGATIPQLRLPSSYDFGTSSITQDVRLTKTFTYKENYRLLLLADIFNAINHANLIGYSPVIGPAFGQPTARAAQTFLSGGPRAIQLGARFQF